MRFINKLQFVLISLLVYVPLTHDVRYQSQLVLGFAPQDKEIPIMAITIMGISLNNYYIKNIPTIVVTTNPITTGLKFLLVNSNGSTPHIAAAGITAQGINVPPPTH